jgi:hypothetical protein
MRNNGKTSMIDYRGYILSFDVILFPMVRSFASHDRHMVYLEGGGLWNRGGGDDGQQRRWWNSGGG